MANGSAALHLVPAPESENTSAPRAGIETAIGIAMADAVEAVGRSLADFDAGGLTPASRTRGGETVAALVELQLSALGTMPEFADVALAEGRNVLNARHRATLHRQLGTDAGIDATFNMLLSHVLEVTAKVVAVERVFRAH
jgi:hypothetical protein